MPTYDRSELINRSIATLREKLIEESIVVASVCLVFLWHVRSALVAIITLPIAIILVVHPDVLFASDDQHHVARRHRDRDRRNDRCGHHHGRERPQISGTFREEHGREPNNGERIEAIIAAAKTVGRPLFFSLLVITVSFMPVFSLTAQEGRLFKPLAFTKTFSMFFAAMLGITLVPVLMTLLIRGKITPETKNPVNRFLISVYEPL